MGRARRGRSCRVTRRPHPAFRTADQDRRGAAAGSARTTLLAGSTGHKANIHVRHVRATCKLAPVRGSAGVYQRVTSLSKP